LYKCELGIETDFGYRVKKALMNINWPALVDTLPTSAIEYTVCWPVFHGGILPIHKGIIITLDTIKYDALEKVIMESVILV
jgi:hypothetical protein